MRLRLFVGMSAIVVLVVGITVVVADVFDIGQHDDQVVGGTALTVPEGEDPTSSTVEASEVLRPGQRKVEGTVTVAHLEGAVLQPREVPLPLTITSDRGFGNGGELTGVVVDGKASSIVWDGGRPFVLSGTGVLVPEPTSIDLVPEGLRVALGGGAHTLTEGSYRLDTPVAVGQAGIATPRDGVSFDAGPSALFEGRGDAWLLVGPEGAGSVVGPGLVHLEGTLTVTGADGITEATNLDATQAAFELTFSPDGAGGWRVSGLVDESGPG